MKINLNSSATAVLTEVGATHYNKYLSQFNFEGRTLPNKKAGFVHKAPLWELFKIYGDVISMGMPVPFEQCEIEVEI